MFKKKYFWIAASVLPILLFQNCGQDVQFSAPDHSEFGASSATGGGNGATNVASNNTGSTLSVSYQLVTETFNVASAISHQVDVVWVIDNSSSMSNEIATVVKNYTQFISSLSQNVDVHSVLISLKKTNSAFNYSGRYGIDLPAGIDPALHKQLDIYVDSTNGMCIANQLLNAVGSRSACPEKFDMPSVFTNVSSLPEVLRPTSRKVFVFVTDDNQNSTQVTPQAFVDNFKNHFGGDTPLVYGFIGVDASTCSISKRGALYSQLIALVGGQAFDICAADWTSHFATLTGSISTNVLNDFSLKNAVIENVIEVTVNGRPLATTDYTISGGHLVVRANLLPGDAIVSITYNILK